MNSQVLQLLASRLNLNAAEAELLQSGDYSQFFSQRIAADPSLATDPMMAALMGSLTSQPAFATESENEDDDDGEPIDARLIERPAAERIASEAMAALRYAAQILGACHCWGQDRDCLECHGCGEPGYRRPRDAATFVSWVQPGLRKIGLRLVRAGASTRYDDSMNRRTE